jgi:N-acetylglutamate synthase-like GNAT family acetyltransferase
MQLWEIDGDTERAFFSCLHLEEPENRTFTRHRRRWCTDHRDKGYRAQVLVRDDGAIVGKCHTIPVQHSPFAGQDLLAILCIYVHMYDHQIGDQRKRGYGRFMLSRIEEDARRRGYEGVVAWAMDWDVWNPVSFYEHLGYTRVDQEDRVVAVWKPFSDAAEPPRQLRLPHTAATGSDTIQVMVADNLWCSSNYKLLTVQRAIEGLEDLVEVHEAGEPYRDRVIHLGTVGGVFIDGAPYRPYQLMGSSDELRAEILRLYELKQASGKE